MYTAGTTNSVNNVPIESPEAMTRPIWKRDTAPAPAAVISGTTPSTIAAVVIRIGRNRIAGGLFDRLALRAALGLQIVGKLHDQDAMFADQAHQRHQSDLGVDIERGAGDSDADKDQRAGDRHRHRDQDDDRIAEAFEQRRKRQEDDDQRKAERGDEPAGLLHVLPAQAAVVDRIVARQRARREILQIGERVALGTPGMATPWIVALLSCWKWLSDSGTVLVKTVATVDSGTSVPSPVRM